ncbi:hypothetical protein [Spirochaeta africana]|uniref:Uncharacterized protein n=1 Tax=Spirochaeta africana (strain ATCC 700263 / DSM 8902 / Z-7692) TaxID=889378 RepID=H9UI60_SPIAZ|nr:hypothetical protein [Spirochaeta africana]AFG37203.1 hypothetical protein Spiaf_1116 [Spirochaeta africana DSM 8902]
MLKGKVEDVMDRFLDFAPWLAFGIIICIYLLVLKILLFDRNSNIVHRKFNVIIAVVGILSIDTSIIVAVLSGLGLIDFVTPEQSLAIGTGIAGLFILLAVVVNRWPVKK